MPHEIWVWTDRTLCVWLMVRIVNRRERWAKWTLAVAVGLPVLYVASFGPVCWAISQADAAKNTLATLYRPIIWTFGDPQDVLDGRKQPLGMAFQWYAEIGAREGWFWSYLILISDDEVIGIHWAWMKPRDSDSNDEFEE